MKAQEKKRTAKFEDDIKNAELERVKEAHEKFHNPDERTKWVELYDKNGNGTFQKSEFQLLLDELAPSMIPEVTGSALYLPLATLDNIYAGKEGLNVDEVYAALKKAMSFLKSQARLHALFETVDKDKSGFLDTSECKDLLQRAAPPGYKVGDVDVAFILKDCDIDGDNNVSLGELGLVVATWLDICKALPANASKHPKSASSTSSACVLL